MSDGVAISFFVLAGSSGCLAVALWLREARRVKTIRRRRFLRSVRF